jgi:hypothetical protein
MVKVCCNKPCEKREKFDQLYNYYGPWIILFLLLINIIITMGTIIYRFSKLYFLH